MVAMMLSKLQQLDFCVISKVLQQYRVFSHAPLLLPLLQPVGKLGLL
jgi:hypothetical protein